MKAIGTCQLNVSHTNIMFELIYVKGQKWMSDILTAAKEVPTILINIQVVTQNKSKLDESR